MKFVMSLVVIAAVAAASVASAAPTENKAVKDELLNLYVLSIAADRCGFPMTNRQSDVLDRETKTLAEKLKMGSDEADAVYSEADITFEKKGHAACDRSGDFAKGFSQTLQKLTGP
jgi:hypothetical protein